MIKSFFYAFIGTVQKRHIRSKYCGVFMMLQAACENSKAETNSVSRSAWIKGLRNVGRLPSSCKNLSVTDIATISFLRVSNVDITSFSPLKHHLWTFFTVILRWLLSDELARLLLLLRERSGHKIRFSSEDLFVFLFKYPFIYWEKEVMFLLKYMWKQRLYPFSGMHTYCQQSAAVGCLSLQIWAKEISAMQY